jgi:cytoskeletal protein RodZ
MTKPTIYARRALIGITVFLQVVFYPAAALAEELTPPADNLAGTSETAPTPTNTPSTTSTSSQDDTSEKQDATSGIAPTPPPAPAVVPPPTGITQPSGADGKTYVKNPNGTWSNDTYTWDPDQDNILAKTAVVFYMSINKY